MEVGYMTTTEDRRLPLDLDVPEPWRLRAGYVPKGRYTDPEFLRLELERLFSRTWLNACRFDEVERVGDYVDFQIGDQSIVVVRTEQGLRAYFNACRHRGTRLVQGQGRIGEVRCPFHAWRWNLDGSLKYIADEENFDPRPSGELCLPEVKVDTWGGWVFVNMDPDAEPLLDYLDPMPTRLQGYKLEDMRIAWYKSVIVNANWKTGLDAFVESWHVPGTHPQLLRPDKHTTPPTIAECEKYGKTFNELFRYHSRHADVFRYGSEGNSTRLRPEYGVNPDAVYDNVVYNLRELRSLYLPTDLGAAAELRTIPEARGPEGNAIYQELRKKHARAAGVDYPELSEEQLKLGMYDWHVFPNTVFLVDFGTALCYRTRPYGDDPDRCIFDVQGLWLPPTEGIKTAEPEHYDDWRVASLGAILEQDFSNMSEVTVGLHSRGFDGYHLNRAQEMTIWNYHRAMDEFLFGRGSQ
jgi:phenylpropionate dioxygenase-like ring-hydroxylating dioxygenase large terminal subunit